MQKVLSVKKTWLVSFRGLFLSPQSYTVYLLISNILLTCFLGTIVEFSGRSPSKSGVGKMKKYEGAENIGPVTAFLSQERIGEMDWDKDGYITYKEFVYSFLKWVGVDESEAETFQ